MALKAIRLDCVQQTANYKKPTSWILHETYPLPPYSAVLGMIHAACGFTEFHDMKISIQGINTGTVSDMCISYTFKAGTQYDSGRHNVKIESASGKSFGISRGIQYYELLCNSHMIIHIIPTEEDFEAVLHGLTYPKTYLSLGRYEDLIDICNIRVVELKRSAKANTKMDLYIPIDQIDFENETVDDDIEDNMIGLNETHGTHYLLNKKYSVVAGKSSYRRWDERVKVMHCPANTGIRNAYTDTVDGCVAVFA